MKHWTNKILALVLAASGAAFIPPAAAKDVMKRACIKNNMWRGSLMSARVRYKYYYNNKGNWSWRTSQWGPVVGHGWTSCVKLDRGASSVRVRENDEFRVEAGASGLFKTYKTNCGSSWRVKGRGVYAAMFVMEGSIYKGRCRGPYNWTEDHPNGCSNKCKSTRHLS